MKLKKDAILLHRNSHIHCLLVQIQANQEIVFHEGGYSDMILTQTRFLQLN